MAYVNARNVSALSRTQKCVAVYTSGLFACACVFSRARVFSCVARASLVRVCEANARRENEGRGGERRKKKGEKEQENRARRIEYARGRRVLARERANEQQTVFPGQKCTSIVPAATLLRERFNRPKEKIGRLN